MELIVFAMPVQDVSKAMGKAPARRGAGSRGGKVVGYNKQGKPIYAGKGKLAVHHLKHLGNDHPKTGAAPEGHHGPGGDTHHDAVLGHLAHAIGDKEVVNAYREAGHVETSADAKWLRSRIRRGKAMAKKPSGGYNEGHKQELLDQMTEMNHHTPMKYISRRM